MIIKPKTNRQIAEEAAEWATRLDAGGLAAGERELLAKWLMTSPVHVDELLFAASLLSKLESVDRDKLIDIEQLLASGRDDVIPLFTDRPQTRNWLRGVAALRRPASRAAIAGKSARHWPAVAAALALAVILPLQFGPAEQEMTAPGATVPSASRDYSTAVGEQRSIVLDDGSLLYMNTGTHVRVTYSPDLRQIELLAGEGLFEVAHDARRPFRVIAGETIAQAVGTTFNVRHSDEGVNVVVIEGKVLVQRVSPEPRRQSAVVQSQGDGGAGEHPVFVVAGQQARLSAADREPVLSQADLMAASAWRLRKLSFDDEPLSAIAAEFNRYNRTQLIVTDPDLAETRISGVFDASDPNSFIAFLELSAGVRVDASQPGRIVLSAQ